MMDTLGQTMTGTSKNLASPPKIDLNFINTELNEIVFLTQDLHNQARSLANTAFGTQPLNIKEEIERESNSTLPDLVHEIRNNLNRLRNQLNRF